MTSQNSTLRRVALGATTLAALASTPALGQTVVVPQDRDLAELGEWARGQGYTFEILRGSLARDTSIDLYGRVVQGDDCEPNADAERARIFTESNQRARVSANVIFQYRDHLVDEGDFTVGSNDYNVWTRFANLYLEDSLTRDTGEKDVCGDEEIVERKDGMIGDKLATLDRYFIFTPGEEVVVEARRPPNDQPLTVDRLPEVLNYGALADKCISLTMATVNYQFVGRAEDARVPQPTVTSLVVGEPRSEDSCEEYTFETVNVQVVDLPAILSELNLESLVRERPEEGPSPTGRSPSAPGELEFFPGIRHPLHVAGYDGVFGGFRIRQADFSGNDTDNREIGLAPTVKITLPLFTYQGDKTTITPFINYEGFYEWIITGIEGIGNENTISLGANVTLSDYLEASAMVGWRRHFLETTQVVGEDLTSTMRATRTGFELDTKVIAPLLYLGYGLRRLEGPLDLQATQAGEATFADSGRIQTTEHSVDVGLWMGLGGDGETFTFIPGEHDLKWTAWAGARFDIDRATTTEGENAILLDGSNKEDAIGLHAGVTWDPEHDREFLDRMVLSVTGDIDFTKNVLTDHTEFLGSGNPTGHLQVGWQLGGRDE